MLSLYIDMADAVCSLACLRPRTVQAYLCYLVLPVISLKFALPIYDVLLSASRPPAREVYWSSVPSAA